MFISDTRQGADLPNLLTNCHLCTGSEHLFYASFGIVNDKTSYFEDGVIVAQV